MQTGRVTLEDMGTPMARIYRGSGRLTGQVVREDVPTNPLDRETNYTWVGGLTRDEFDTQFMREEHTQCHDQRHSDRDCPQCASEGWVR